MVEYTTSSLRASPLTVVVAFRPKKVVYFISPCNWWTMVENAEHILRAHFDGDQSAMYQIPYANSQ